MGNPVILFDAFFESKTEAKKRIAKFLRGELEVGREIVRRCDDNYRYLFIKAILERHTRYWDKVDGEVLEFQLYDAGNGKVGIRYMDGSGAVKTFSWVRCIEETTDYFLAQSVDGGRALLGDIND